MPSAFADMVRYALASAFSFALVLGATATLHELLGVSQTLAPAIALVLAFGVNFILLRAWVFPGQSRSISRQLAATAIASVAFRAFEYGLFLGLHLGLELDYLIATGASLCVSALGKFAVYREIVFSRGRSEASPAAGPSGPPGSR